MLPPSPVTDGSSMTFDGVETIDFSGSYDIDGDGSHGGGPHGGGSHGTGQVLIAGRWAGKYIDLPAVFAA